MIFLTLISELTEIAEIDSLNEMRQGKDPDDVAIGDLK